MNILDAIQGIQGGGAVRELGGRFGLSEDQASAALAALVPALAAGFQLNASSPAGLDGLLGALGGGQHQRYVDDSSALGDPATISDGNNILGHVFGSKDVSRQVANQVASQTGIGESVLKSMLPVVAAMMMGTMSKQVNAPAGMQAGPSGGGDALLDMLAPLVTGSGRGGGQADGIAGLLGRLLSGGH
jgi:hypothetical protein